MRYFLILFLLVCLVSCDNEPPVYPFDQSPYIEFEQLQYFDQDRVDTLQLSIIVWDREGDFGLDSNNESILFPYHAYNLIVDSDGTLIRLNGGDYSLPFYSVPLIITFDKGITDYNVLYEEKVFYSNNDSLPPYSCANYGIFPLSIDGIYSVNDTFRIEENINHFNLDIEFTNGNGELYNFQETFNTDQCSIGDFDTRVPFANVNPYDRVAGFEGTPFRISWINQYSRRIEYKMLSQVFRLMFLDNRFSIQMSVKDRELNNSNVVQSDFITLEEIRVE